MNERRSATASDRRQLSEYGEKLDQLLTTVILRCEAQRDCIPEKKLDRADVERIRNSANRIFTEFYAGVTQLKHRYNSDLDS